MQENYLFCYHLISLLFFSFICLLICPKIGLVRIAHYDLFLVGVFFLLFLFFFFLFYFYLFLFIFTGSTSVFSHVVTIKYQVEYCAVAMIGYESRLRASGMGQLHLHTADAPSMYSQRLSLRRMVFIMRLQQFFEGGNGDDPLKRDFEQ